MAKRPNFLVLYCDQLRADALGCYGSSIGATPVLDRFAGEGVLFENHYATNPVCMPSRASLFTGQHPQAHGVLDNGVPLRECEPTLPGVLAGSGYRTHSIGKIHLTPTEAEAASGCRESTALWRTGALDDWTGPYYGFGTVELSIGHGEAAFTRGGHYGRWVRENFEAGKWRLGPDAAEGPKCPGLACWRSNLPAEAHHSTWVAERAVEFLKGAGEEPFFLFVSFPDPHHPFTPPAKYAARFDPAAMPAPNRREGENDAKPYHYRKEAYKKRHGVKNAAYLPDGVVDADLALVSAHYHASVALIDQSAGRVLAALEEAGLAGETVVLFTADHGELLGDHGMIYKGPFPCRALLRVPLLVRAPGGAAGRCETVNSCADVMPTLFDLAGVEPPPTVQGDSMRAALEDPAAAAGDGRALVTGWSKICPEFHQKTLYTPEWRVTWFPNQDAGELYDLASDPHEIVNLFDDPKHRATRERLMGELLRCSARADTRRVPAIAKW